MAKIHMLLQGKGGVGKSLIASIIAQYYYAKKRKILCIDTDPVNSSFSSFRKLNVTKIDLMDGDNIDPRKFDHLIELIYNSKTDVIIDNGASTFVSLSNYLISNRISEFLKNSGHELVIHTVVTGGQALLDTLNGFNAIMKQFPNDISSVVWLNPYWGKIRQDGKDFESMKAYLDNKARISAIIKIPEYKPETFGVDLKEILQEKLTFDEALANEKIFIMVRQRLEIIRKDFFDQLETVEAALG